MSKRLSSEAVTVIVSISETCSVQESEAHFLWPEGTAEDSYTLLTDDVLDIDFDSHLPVRPLRMRWLSSIKGNDIARPDIISQLFHKSVVGLYAGTILLDSDVRMQLAALQINAADTPELLRQVCMAIAHHSQEQTADVAE